MKLNEIKEKLNLETLNLSNNLEIKSGYVCDLLSEVMGKAKENSLWITVHTNLNVLAVASMLDLGGIIISEDNKVNEEFIKKAEEEEINIFLSPKSSFELAGKLYEIGIR